MRRSEFHRAVADEFGDRGASVVQDLALGQIGWRTAAEALDEGVPTRDIWLALCVEADVPESRRHGAGRLDPNDAR